MRKYIILNTDLEDHPVLTGAVVTFGKCGVAFHCTIPEPDFGGNVPDSEVIHAYICALPPHKQLRKISVRYTDDNTDEGLIRLIQKIKPIICDIEQRGFCEGCGDEYQKHVKLAGFDMCGACAFKASLTTGTDLTAEAQGMWG